MDVQFIYFACLDGPCSPHLARTLTRDGFSPIFQLREVAQLWMVRTMTQKAFQSIMKSTRLFSKSYGKKCFVAPRSERIEPDEYALEILMEDLGMVADPVYLRLVEEAE